MALAFEVRPAGTGLARRPIPGQRLGTKNPAPGLSTRCRLLAGAAVAGLAVTVGLLGGGPLAAPGEQPAAANGKPHVYLVRPGDTLWSIAARLAKGSDPRPVMDRLASHVGPTLQVGQRIVLPS